jgi:hypothetical protein
MTTLVTRKLQASGTVVWSVAEVDSQIEECLKEFSTYQPHIVPIVFKVESRFGVATATSASSLVDTNKGQFLSTDSEKVVCNITDNTYSVISSFASTASVGLTSDIFEVGESYEIYNKQCTNQRQIYIGDVPENYSVHSVEYPIGQRRNFVQLEKILEIGVDWVDDSDSTLENKGNVDVLVRFTKPHVISQLTDWAGKLSATAAVGATTLAMTSLQGAGTIEVGEEFTLQYHRSTYVVNAATTIASSASAAVPFYPPLEAAAASTTWVTTFRQSTLSPWQEDIFADMCAARLSINKSPKYFNITVTGSGDVPGKYFDWGERRLAEVFAKLQRNTPPRTKKRFTQEFTHFRRFTG